MERICGFLIVLALIAAMAGCVSISPSGGSIGEYCTLSITSTAGGSVTTPGEGTFACAEGEVVNLLAEPEEGYQFTSWSGCVGTIANLTAASTTITASASYSIRADFSGNASSPLGINYTEAEAEQLIIVLVNDEREQYDLTTLSEDALLTSLAREHSAYMAEYDLLTHDRFPGERPLSYNMSPGDTRGENLAKIPTQQYSPGPYLSLQEVCEWAVSGWMDSLGHRENILQPIFTETGVGVSFSEEGAFTYLYITQIFEGDY
ncbi:MAG: CAP domain-containing protein [Dehalococcoidia bacterium]